MLKNKFLKTTAISLVLLTVLSINVFAASASATLTASAYYTETSSLTAPTNQAKLVTVNSSSTYSVKSLLLGKPTTNSSTTVRENIVSIKTTVTNDYIDYGYYAYYGYMQTTGTSAGYGAKGTVTCYTK